MFFQVHDEEIDAESQLIELGGEIDLHSAPEFRDRVNSALDAGKTRLLIDFEKATFIDSAAIGVIFEGMRRINASGGTMTVVCTTENVRRVLDIAGVCAAVPVRESREEALAALGA